MIFLLVYGISQWYVVFVHVSVNGIWYVLMVYGVWCHVSACGRLHAAHGFCRQAEPVEKSFRLNFPPYRTKVATTQNQSCHLSKHVARSHHYYKITYFWRVKKPLVWRKWDVSLIKCQIWPGNFWRVCRSIRSMEKPTDASSRTRVRNSLLRASLAITGYFCWLYWA